MYNSPDVEPWNQLASINVKTCVVVSKYVVPLVGSTWGKAVEPMEHCVVTAHDDACTMHIYDSSAMGVGTEAPILLMNRCIVSILVR